MDFHVVYAIIDGTDCNVNSVHAEDVDSEDLDVEGEVGEGDGSHCDVVAD